MSVTGVTGEERDDFSRAESKQIRRRSTRLLVSTIQPVKRSLILTAATILVATAANVAGPALIGVGLDRALPALLDTGDSTGLALVIGAYVLVAVTGAVLVAKYQVMSARIAQEILIDLRKRMFLHTQKLSLEFHETYTSGRIISRQTSDLDSTAASTSSCRARSTWRSPPSRCSRSTGCRVSCCSPRSCRCSS
jgi:ATP-binding cassette subfamily B protein